jgi:hypothetical protein
LTRAELSRYPEFSPSAFTAMDDTDALRYERRLHRVFAPDTKPYDGRPVYENLPVYETPTWLMTGVWMSDSSGFAVTPPRADSDAASVRPVGPPQPETGAYERTASYDSGTELASTPSGDRVRLEERGAKPEREQVIARDPSTDAAAANREDTATENATRPREPRIERYRER